MTDDTIDYETIEANRDQYQRRADRLAPENTHIRVLLPAEESSPEALAVYHELMTEHGWLGIEYACEALHSEGDTYFDDFAEDSPRDLLDDFQRFKDTV